MHTLKVPVIAAGDVSTVTICVTYVDPSVYEILAVPTATPVTIPVPEPTLAILPLLVLHVPPVVVFVIAIVVPLHTLEGPLIGSNAMAFSKLISIITARSRNDSRLPEKNFFLMIY